MRKMADDFQKVRAKSSKATTAVTFEASLVDVLDGDTLRAKREDGTIVTIRLAEIDAPEPAQAYGFDATEKLRSLLIGRTFQVSSQQKDRYGRLLASVTVDRKWINRVMLYSGLAWHYVKYSKDNKLAIAERYAKKKKIGIWSNESQISPWDYRNGVREATETPINAPSIRHTDIKVFITDHGKRYHQSSCRYLRQSKQEIPLSRADAYEPCRHCKPPTR